MKTSGTGIIFAASLLFSSAPCPGQIEAGAPCEPPSDRNVYSLPPLPQLPPAGGVFHDPTFCTPILRVTDENDGRYFQNAYSYWPTFNRNNSRIYILQDEGSLRGLVHRFDPKTLSISDKEYVLFEPTPDGSIPSREDAIWSALDPDVLFCHSRLNLWAYNVRTHSYTLIRNFDAELGNGYFKQMSRSIDDNTFAFTTMSRRYRETGSLVWRRNEDRAIIRPLEPEGLDEVQIDKSGRYLVIKTDGQGKSAIQVRILDIDTGAVAELTDGPPDYAPGHGDVGFGEVIGADNWLNRMRLRKLSDPHTKKTIFDLGNDWTQDIHVSWLLDDRAWVLYSLYSLSACDSRGLFHNEIILMRTDGSEEVRRLTHHRSCVSDYWDSPRANISRDGRFVAFTSNWGGVDRRDVFILKVTGGPAPKSARRIAPP